MPAKGLLIILIVDVQMLPTIAPPQDVDEAARIDGRGRLGALFLQRCILRGLTAGAVKA
jgi:ABC-type glycerol-3-phosphate transport system permease component